MSASPLTRLRLSQTARPVDVILYWHREQSMELNAPYQRGDVWSETRQRNLIRSILLGIPIPSIIINDRASAGWDELVSCAVIDGKQRLTAILKFMLDDLAVPGEWFGVESAISHGMIVFSDLPIARQRGFRNHPIPFTEGQLGSLDEEREVFDLVNFGGVPQGQSDLKPASKTVKTRSVDLWQCRGCGWVTQAEGVSCDCKVPALNEWDAGFMMFFDRR